MTQSVAGGRILTIPNLISLIRILGVGVFWWALIARDDVALAAWLIFGIGWTDWVDGYLARRLNQVSELGKALDPVADRLMIVSALVGGLIVGVVPGWIGVPLLVREGLMAIVSGVLVARGHRTLEVRYAGKLATFLLYGAIPAFYLVGAGVLPGLMRPLGWLTGTAGLILYWYVAVLYLNDARNAMRGLESGHPDDGAR